MSMPYPERRRSARARAAGRVEVLFENPLPVLVPAELLETSAQGFRLSHNSKDLTTGLDVVVRQAGSSRHAKVIWTHLRDGRWVSGFLLL